MRPVKQDVPFIEEQIIPILFRPGALNNNFRLHSFFLHEVARLLNSYGPPLVVDLSPEKFSALSDPLKFLQLCRRREHLGSSLFSDNGSLEYHVHRVGTFRKLGQKSKLHDAYLNEWNYLRKETFWSKVRASIKEFTGKLGGLFQSFRYTRLVFSQRRPAYFFHVLLILWWLALAILTPYLWDKYSDDKLKDLNERIEALNQPT